MGHQRNSEGLRKSVQLRHQKALQKLEEGMERLVREERPITFRAVAEAAGVSTAWLYRHPEIRSRIDGLRERHQGHHIFEAKSSPSATTPGPIVVALRQRIKDVEEENRELKRQLEVVYGLLYKKEARAVSH